MSATQKQIIAAYRRLAKAHHPDFNEGPEATERMQEINWAYDLLSDPAARARYDLGIYLREIGQKYPSEYGPNPTGHEDVHGAHRVSRRFAKLWVGIFGRELRILKDPSRAGFAGAVAALAVFAFASYMSDIHIAVMVTLPAMWLVALLPVMASAGRSGGMIGTLLGLFGSSLACAAFSWLSHSGAGAADLRIPEGEAILLLGIPIATIAGSLLGWVGGGE